MSEHTRGRWKLRTEHPAYNTGKPSEVVVYTDEREVLRTLSEPASIGDFFLIVASPELLEAAKSLVAHLPDPNPDSLATKDEAIRATWNAIAKAEGRELSNQLED